MPEPGPYGPLPVSYPRPWSLQGYVALYMATFIWHALAIWEGGSNIIGWVPGFVVVYLAWRGSKIAPVIAIVAEAIYLGLSATEIQMATASGGHHPLLHVVESVLLLAMLVLLLLPTTRRFYDLDERNAAG